MSYKRRAIHQSAEEHPVRRHRSNEFLMFVGIVLFALALVSSLRAQTALPMSQIKAPAVSTPASLPAGTCVLVAVPGQVGSQFQCVPLSMVQVPPALPIPFSPPQGYTPSAPMATVTLSCKYAFIYLNGLYLSTTGGDYTVDQTGLIVTFTGRLPGTQPGDSLVVAYAC